MTLPDEPVTLSVSQIDGLNRELSKMRHDINNHLSLMMAAVEVIRRKPEAADRMTATFNEQPRKVTDAMMRFSAEFEQRFRVQQT